MGYHGGDHTNRSGRVRRRLSDGKTSIAATHLRRDLCRICLRVARQPLETAAPTAAISSAEQFGKDAQRMSVFSPLSVNTAGAAGRASLRCGWTARA
jgi:hypothetical protein